jgi:hypothetical protein
LPRISPWILCHVQHVPLRAGALAALHAWHAELRVQRHHIALCGQRCAELRPIRWVGGERVNQDDQSFLHRGPSEAPSVCAISPCGAVEMDQIKGFLPSAGLCSQVYHKEQFVPQEVLDGALSLLPWPFLQDFAGVKAPNVECARLSPSPIMCSACLLPQHCTASSRRCWTFWCWRALSALWALPPPASLSTCANTGRCRWVWVWGRRRAGAVATGRGAATVMTRRLWQTCSVLLCLAAAGRVAQHLGAGGCLPH